MNTLSSSQSDQFVAERVLWSGVWEFFIGARLRPPSKERCTQLILGKEADFLRKNWDDLHAPQNFAPKKAFPHQTQTERKERERERERE